LPKSIKKKQKLVGKDRLNTFKIKIDLSNIQPRILPPQSRYELDRTANIKIKGKNEETREFEIDYYDLQHEELLGQGQFGTVKKMYHKAFDLTFAVKVIFYNTNIFEKYLYKI
jgi:hypothetical protein